jgi:hypothetical protein
MSRQWLTFYYMTEKEFQAEVAERTALKTRTNQ